MKRRRFGETSLECSVVGLGTWGLGGPNDVEGIAFGWRDISDAMAEATIRAALEQGINFFDSSDFYGRGRGEERLGRALRGTSNIVVATKVGIIPRLCPGTDDLDRDFTAEHIRRSAEESLRRLRRDTIDIYQLHGPGLGVLDCEETWRVLGELRQSGMVRYLGVSLKSSHMQGALLSRWLENPLISSVQLEYSVAHPARVAGLEAMRPNTAIIARSVLGHGLLLRNGTNTAIIERDDHRKRKWDDVKAARARSFAEAARPKVPTRSLVEALVRFAVDAPAVSVALLGATSPEQVMQLAEAVRGGVMTVNERTGLLDVAGTIYGT